MIVSNLQYGTGKLHDSKMELDKFIKVSPYLLGMVIHGSRDNKPDDLLIYCGLTVLKLQETHAVLMKTKKPTKSDINFEYKDSIRKAMCISVLFLLCTALITDA